MRKDKTIQVRVTQAEYDVITSAAKGYKSLSHYSRAVLVEWSTAFTTMPTDAKRDRRSHKLLAHG